MLEENYSRENHSETIIYHGEYVKFVTRYTFMASLRYRGLREQFSPVNRNYILWANSTFFFRDRESSNFYIPFSCLFHQTKRFSRL